MPCPGSCQIWAAPAVRACPDCFPLSAAVSVKHLPVWSPRSGVLAPVFQELSLPSALLFLGLQVPLAVPSRGYWVLPDLPSAVLPHPLAQLCPVWQRLLGDFSPLRVVPLPGSLDLPGLRSRRLAQSA